MVFILGSLHILRNKQVSYFNSSDSYNYHIMILHIRAGSKRNEIMLQLYK